MLKFLLMAGAWLMALAGSVLECIGWFTLAVRWVTESHILVMPVSTTFTMEKSLTYIGYGLGLYVVAALTFWFAQD